MVVSLYLAGGLSTLISVLIIYSLSKCIDFETCWEKVIETKEEKKTGRKRIKKFYYNYDEDSGC